MARRSMFAVIGLVSLLAVVLSAPVDAAVPPYLTDALIARPVIEDYSASDNVYQDLPAQTLSDKVKPGGSAKILIGGGVDGSNTDTLAVKGCASSPGFRVNYRNWNGTNITDEVTNGTFEVGPLSSGSTFTWVRMVVKVAKFADRGDKLLCKVKISSTGGASTDAVAHKVIVR